MKAKLLANGVEWVCLVLMAALSVDLMLGVFSRYVLASTFTWYDEIARLLFVWIVFLGAAVGVRRSGHFRLHLVIDRFPPGLRRAAEILGVLAIMGFGAVLIQQGWKLVELGQFQQTPVMGLSKRYVYGSMPAGGALIILYSARHLWRAVTGAPGAAPGH